MELNEYLINEGVYDKGIFKAIFLAGSPGSGKSYVRSKILRGEIKAKTINPDIFYEYAMKKENIPMMHSRRTGEQEERHKKIEIEARKKLPIQFKMWIDNRLPILIDRTGAHFKDRAWEKNKLDELGYESIMIYVKTDVEVAKKRNIKRERSLDPKIIPSYDKVITEQIPKFKALFGKNFWVIDNTGEFNEEKKKEWDVIWKNVKKFLHTPTSNPAANKWKKEQLEEKKK